MDALRHDVITWHCHTKVEKYRSDLALLDHDPFEVIEIDGNLLLNAGISRVMSLIGGLGGQAFDATHSRIGVGSDTTAAAATQTILNPSGAGGLSKYFRPVDATFPKLTGSTPPGLQFAATYGSTEANFQWNEWGIDNGAGTGSTEVAPLLNRKQESLGTKSNGSWVLTVTLSLS